MFVTTRGVEEKSKVLPYKMNVLNVLFLDKEVGMASESIISREENRNSVNNADHSDSLANGIRSRLQITSPTMTMLPVSRYSMLKKVEQTCAALQQGRIPDTSSLGRATARASVLQLAYEVMECKYYNVTTAIKNTDNCCR